MVKTLCIYSSPEISKSHKDTYCCCEFAHVKTKVQALVEIILFHHHASDTNFGAASHGNS